MNNAPLRTLGLTVQVRVSDFAVGSQWYQRLFGREPDYRPHADFWEWELGPMGWLQVTEGTPTAESGPLRFGVHDIVTERLRLQQELGIDVSEVERLDGVAAWCNFHDPFGNRLGLFQDLSSS